MPKVRIWLPALATLVGLAFLVAHLPGPGSVGAADATVQVGQGGARFVPNSVNINPGDSVTFEHASGSHNVTFVRPIQQVVAGGDLNSRPWDCEFRMHSSAPSRGPTDTLHVITITGHADCDAEMRPWHSHIPPQRLA